MKHHVKFFILFFTLFYNSYAKEIDINIKKEECKNNKTSLCVCVINLINSLKMLDSIQKNNFLLIQRELKDTNKQQIENYKTLQKEHIISITQHEYNSLRQYMKKFCDSFKQLNKQEIATLFSLTWNNKLLFQDIKGVNVFCKQQYKL